MANEQFRPGFSMAGAVDLESLKHKVDAEPGDEGGAPRAGGYVIDVNENTFQAMVESSATYPILLLLWVTDDNRVFDMARTLGDAVNQMGGKIQLARIDASQNPAIAQAFQVRAVPALFGLIGGRPMPILEGVPSDVELAQVIDEIVPKFIEVAAQAGITGTAPYMEPSDGADAEAEDAAPAEPQAPATHNEALQALAQGDYAAAAEAYGRVIEADPHDQLAARERSKALLLARSGNANVREVREWAAAEPDNVEAQLAVADIDMIGGQIQDAFDRLLDFVATHKSDMEPVRQRLLEYFQIPDASDERLGRARRRLATLMY